MIEIKIPAATKAILKDLANIDKNTEDALREALFEIGSESVRHARRLITSGRRTGRIYNFGGKIHQASAPGEAPANLSGRLQKSLYYNVRGTSEVEYGARTPYAAKLELGPKNEPEKARPYLATTAKHREIQNIRVIEYYLNRRLIK